MERMIKEICPICEEKLNFHKGAFDFEYYYCPQKIEIYNGEPSHYTFCIRTSLLKELEWCIIPPYKITNVTKVNNKYWVIDEIKKYNAVYFYYEIIRSPGEIKIDKNLSADRLKKIIILS